MAKIIPKTIELHPRQFDAFSSKTQFTLAVAGVRGGKTYVGAVWAGDKIANIEGDGLITAPDFQTLRDATLSTFFGLFPNYRKFYKEQKHIIEFPNGKKVYLRSLDDPYSAEGLTVSWAWGDEAGKYKIAAWHSLRSRVSLVKGPVFLTTTPYNLGWLYEEFYQRWEKKLDDDLGVYQWDSVDNPAFPREVWEAEKGRLSPAEFDRRYRGRFARMQGLVYSPSALCFIDEAPKRADIMLGGIDWGWTHHAALIAINVYQGRVTLVDEWYQTKKTTPEIIQAAIEMQNKWGINRWYADSANPEKIAEANNNTGLFVVGYEKTAGSINAGVDYIRGLMLENRFFMLRGLTNTKDEMDLYQYPEKPNPKDDPIPENNHLMDAMRYPIMGYQPAKRVQIPQLSFTQDSVRRMLSNNGRRIRGGDDVL